MVDAKDDKAAGPEDVKKATADAAKKADDSKKAANTADEKARGVTGSSDDKAAEKKDVKAPVSRFNHDAADAKSADKADVAEPKRASRGKPAAGKEKVVARDQAESFTSETPENREGNAAPKLPDDAVTPEYVMDEEHNRRPGPEKNPDNKAFPDPNTGMEPAPLEKDKADQKREARPTPLQGYRDGHAALQEDQQWIINREQARVTTSETPAGDSSEAPEGNESANWVDKPARAHTLAEPDDYNTADSVGQRLKRAADSARLEERPEHRGIHSDALPGAYTVEEELRLQWPGVELGDVEE